MLCLYKNTQHGNKNYKTEIVYNLKFMHGTEKQISDLNAGGRFL